METADIMLCLGGDKGNTVQKFSVTPSEIAVLRQIHGDEAVFDVKPLAKTVNISHREERDRLRETYGRMEGDRRVAPAVDALFPGAASPVFTRIAELDLPEEFFKAETRVRASEPEPEPEVEEPEEEKTTPPKPLTKAQKAAAKKAEKEAAAAEKAAREDEEATHEDAPQAEDAVEDDDGIREINDGQGEHLFD